MFDKLSSKTTHAELMDCIWRLLFNINHSREMTSLIQKQRDALEKYYATIAPPSLFRYRPIEEEIIDRELNTLKDNKMWFSVKSALNDVFEIRVKERGINDYEHLHNQIKQLDDMIAKCNDMQKQLTKLGDIENIEQLKSDIELQKSNIELQKTNLQSIKPSNYQEMVNSFWGSSAISCLSERNDNILMWSHYASNNRGMCIEYSMRELVQNTNFIMAPVNYSSEPPSTNRYAQSEVLLMNAMFTKYSGWEYEKEWRCIIARYANDTYDGRAPFGIDKGIALETSPVKAIYLGCNIKEDILKKVVGLCKDTLNVPVYKMECSQSAYLLTPKLL